MKIITSPSDFNTRISLQYQTKTPDGRGGFTTSWVTAATVWSKKTTHKSDEAIQAMKETGVATHNYRIRHRTDVRASWRIIEGNRVMSIAGPPMERIEGGLKYLDIVAKEAS